MMNGPVLNVHHSKVRVDIPRGACDCHVHVFGPERAFPMWEGRSYTPPPATVETLIAHQSVLGLDRVVIVQPSIYGTDNRCTLDAVARIGSDARAIVVVDRETPDHTLHELSNGGAVGLRLNLAAGAADDLDKIRRDIDWAFELAVPLGWHLQIFTELQIVTALEQSFRSAPIPVVIDHFGRADAAKGLGQPGFDLLVDLVAAGCVHVKLSAPYLISSAPSHEDVAPLIQAFVAANSARLLWGSNWPHPGGGTGIPADGVVPFRNIDDGDAISRFASSLNDAAILKQILVDNPARLFGFTDNFGLPE